MASTSASAAVSDHDLAFAEQQFEDGVELLEADDFVAASDCFAQCLEVKVTKFGEHDPAVAPVYLKYAASLLGCARQGDNLLGSLKTNTQNDGASTSSGAGKEAPGDDDGSDLGLAWQMAELARLVFSSNIDKVEDINAKLAEVHEVLADISAEREAFEDAINDFEEAFKFLDACAEVDVRWQAEVHFKISIPLELMDRVDDAMTHINTAIAQLKYLLKQRMAARDELARAEAEAPPAAAAADDNVTPAPEPPAAAAAEAEPAPAGADASADPAPESASNDATAAVADAAGDGDAGPTEGKPDDDEAGGEEGAEEAEETELEGVVREISELEGVLKDLEERRQELVTAKEQDKAVKQQLKAMLGTNALADFHTPAAGAGAAKSGGAAVQDLGVKGGKRTKENVDASVEAKQEGKEAKSGDKADSGAASTKRTLEDVMGGGDANGKSTKKAAH